MMVTGRWLGGGRPQGHTVVVVVVPADWCLVPCCRQGEGRSRTPGGHAGTAVAQAARRPAAADSEASAAITADLTVLVKSVLRAF